MAPRANWKGYLRLSLVSCSIALFPATSEREKVSFHQLNSETGNRVRMRRVDEGTGDEVPYEKIVKGYELGKHIVQTKSGHLTTTRRRSGSCSGRSRPARRSSRSSTSSRPTS